MSKQRSSVHPAMPTQPPRVAAPPPIPTPVVMCCSNPWRRPLLEQRFIQQQPSDAGTPMTETVHSATLFTAAKMARVFCRDHVRQGECVTADDLGILAGKFAAIENDPELKDSVRVIALECVIPLSYTTHDVQRVVKALLSLCPRLGEPE